MNEQSKRNIMKRIWFTQQKPFDYMPLRAGLGLIRINDLREYAIFNGSKVKDAILKAHQRNCKSLTDIGYNPEMLCPKFYTTRTHKLEEDYFVVEGSRFKAKLIEPRIEFTAELIGRLNLRNLNDWDGITEGAFILGHVPKDVRVIAGDDLGYKAAIEHLKDELLALNSKATLDTPFYVHRLWGINQITDETLKLYKSDEVG